MSAFTIIKPINGKETVHNIKYASDREYNAETRAFYDVIILLLYLKSKKDSIDFQNSIIECKNKNMREIKNYLIIFEEFKSYIL